MEPGIAVTGDRRLLEICLRHLLENAFKFTRPRDGAAIEVGREAADGRSAVYIRDNGVGFDPRYAGRMFGAFQKLHSNGQFEGAGMGLAVVQRIVHRHGGSVWASGEVDRGATLYLTL